MSDTPSDRQTSRPRAALLLCAALALAAAVRLVNWMQVRDGSILYFHHWAQSDMHFFHQWARAIAAGDWLTAPRPYHRWHGEVALEVHRRQHPGEPFDEWRGRELWTRWLGERVFYQDPLYAYMLAGCYVLLGPRVEPVLLLQSLMGLAAVALVFALGWMLGGRWTGFVGAVLAALYAPLVFYEGTLLRGALQALLSLGLLAAAERACRAARPGRWWLAAGCAGGLLVLTHSTGLLLLAALAAILFWQERRARWRRSLLLLAGGAALTLAPLAVRNLMVGLPPLTSPAYGPVNFIISNAADRDPWIGFHVSAHTDEILQATDGKLLPAITATLATHDGLSSWLRLTGRKVLVFLSASETVDNINFDYYLRQAPFMAAVGVRFGLVVPLAVAGLLMAGRRLVTMLPLVMGIGSGVLIAVVFFTSSRLRLSTALMMVPFAAFALVEATRRARGGRARSLVVPAAAALLTAAIALVRWSPGVGLRDSDYGVGNAIAAERMKQRAARGDLDGAVRTLRVQLRTEPEGLRRLDPERGRAQLPHAEARVASLFEELHRLAAALYEQRGDREEAWEHARRARILEAVARQYEASHPP